MGVEARPATWQKHFDAALYAHYHREIWLPERVRRAAIEFLPSPSTPLRLSRHYREVMGGRGLPEEIRMPAVFSLVTVTVVRETQAIFRVMVRFRWTGEEKGRRRQRDLAMVLEGDFEVATAYWCRPDREYRPERGVTYERRGGRIS